MRNWRSLTLGLAAGVGAAASFFACTGRWCTTYTNVLACDDFDVSDDHPAQQALSTQAASGDAGASIILSTNAAYSAPNGIVASTFPFEGNAGSGVALTGPLWIGTKAPPASITCEFQILPASLSTEPDDAARVFAFDLVDPAGTYHGRLGLVVAANGAVTFQEDHLTAQSTTDLAPLYLPSPPIGADPLDGSLPDDDSGVIVPPPDAGNASTITPIPIALGGGWFHVKIALSVGPPSTFTAQVASASISGTLTEPLPGAMSASVALGAAATGASSSGWTFLYDNFVCY